MEALGLPVLLRVGGLCLEVVHFMESTDLRALGVAVRFLEVWELLEFLD